MPNSRAFLTAILLSTICCTAPLHAQSESPDKPKRKIVTAPALQQAPVDFNHPPREYVSREAQGWDVFIEKELADQEPERAKAALGRLDAKLGEIVKVLPESALPDLRKVKIFIMHGQHAKNGGRSSGLEYFRQESPKHYEWLDPRMASSIVIYDAENYLRLTDHWALKALMHEMGHAHHLEHWPEERADIYDAWKAAIDGGLYQTVREEDKDAFNPNYAAQNHLEYFAELSATYFTGNNYFPRDRAALKDYDPAGYKLIEQLWGISEGK